ncbi:polyphosphate kinase 2 [Phenylobacterium sp.]|uniref:polyphosphate kinase 2 n=1 Tax=Phenylobacterium sp. TaxID=1871053 RepID=UPI003564FED7
MSKDDDYDRELAALQAALVRFQIAAIKAGEKSLVIFEGRDAAGKDGAIKRITEHLSVRNTRAIALPKPTDREATQWYFQRYVRHLPAAGEFVLFNRSWYNRAGVEPVMGFCTPDEHEAFLRDAPVFEAMVVKSGVRIVKLWLDISREEQARRLKARTADPLKALKVSPLDAVAQAKWDAYTEARDQMLRRTHTADAPWIVVRTDHKKKARLNTIRYLLRALAPKAIAKTVDKPDPKVVFEFETEALTDGRLER